MSAVRKKPDGHRKHKDNSSSSSSSSSSQRRAIRAAKVFRSHVRRHANMHGWESAQRQLAHAFIQADTDADGKLCPHELELVFELILGTANALPKSARVLRALMSHVLYIAAPISTPASTSSTSAIPVELWPDFACIASFVALDQDELYERLLLFASKARHCIVEEHEGRLQGLWNRFSRVRGGRFRFTSNKRSDQARVMGFEDFLLLARHLRVGIDSLSPHEQLLGLFGPLCDDAEPPSTHLGGKHITLQSFKTKMSELLRECRSRALAEREISDAAGKWCYTSQQQSSRAALPCKCKPLAEMHAIHNQSALTYHAISSNITRCNACEQQQQEFRHAIQVQHYHVWSKCAWCFRNVIRLITECVSSI
jgi:hypothetical protein